MKDLIVRYARQPSTWKGITIVLGAFGIYVNPQVMDAIAVIVGVVVGGIDIAKDEFKHLPKEGE